MQNMRAVAPRTKKLWARKVPRVISFWPIFATRNRLTICIFGKDRARNSKFCRHIHKSPKTYSTKFGVDRMYSLWVIVCQSRSWVLALFPIGEYEGVTVCAPTRDFVSQFELYPRWVNILKVLNHRGISLLSFSSLQSIVCPKFYRNRTINEGDSPKPINAYGTIPESLSFVIPTVWDAEHVKLWSQTRFLFLPTIARQKGIGRSLWHIVGKGTIGVTMTLFW